MRTGMPVREDCVPLPEHFDEIIQSWDLSFKDRKTSDFVCGLVVGRAGALKYLLDIYWRRADFVETKRAIRDLSLRWPTAFAKYVEDSANGPAILAELGSEISGLIPVKALGSKEARLYAASPDVEAGNVYLPHPSTASWVSRFIDELAAACCGGRHDDAADALSMAIYKLRNTNSYGLCAAERLLAAGLIKPLPPPSLPVQEEQREKPLSSSCPSCGSTSIAHLAACDRCQQCGAQFHSTARTAAPFTRGDWLSRNLGR